jgi:segregation and condensation protein B
MLPKPKDGHARTRMSDMDVSDNQEQPTDTAAAPAEPTAGEAAALAPEILTLRGHLEALLLSIDRPLAAEKAARALGLIPEDKPEEKPEPAATSDTDAPVEESPAKKRASARRSAVIESAERIIEQLVASLNEAYETTGRAFRIERVAGGLRVMTQPAFAPTLARFHKDRQQTRLSKAGVETLAIIAYRQPITRAELESIRGVSCGEVLKSLLDRRLVGIKGRAEELGRPLLYGTTKQFLDHFGLATTADLPSPEELRASL